MTRVKGLDAIPKADRLCAAIVGQIHPRPGRHHHLAAGRQRAGGNEQLRAIRQGQRLILGGVEIISGVRSPSASNKAVEPIPFTLRQLAR